VLISLPPQLAGTNIPNPGQNRYLGAQQFQIWGNVIK
jgi:hypothetical protein